MDLYPEAFIAKGFLTSGNWIVKYYRSRIKKYVSLKWIVLGTKQYKFLDSIYDLGGHDPIVIPCGIHSESHDELKKANDKIVFAYAGNLGEAHSEEFLNALVSLSEPDKHEFIISCFGLKSRQTKEYLSAFSNVKFVDWISKKEMNEIDIQIVTLKSDWTHVCVPSKAISAICYQTPIIFHGDKEGDIYEYLENALWHIPDDQFMDKSIGRFYASLQKENIEVKKKEARKAAKKFNHLFESSVQKLTKYLLA